MLFDDNHIMRYKPISLSDKMELQCCMKREFVV